MARDKVYEAKSMDEAADEFDKDITTRFRHIVGAAYFEPNKPQQFVLNFPSADGNGVRLTVTATVEEVTYSEEEVKAAYDGLSPELRAEIEAKDKEDKPSNS